MTRERCIAALAVAFAVLWVALAIDPYDRSDWALENVLLVAGVATLVVTRRSLPLSNASYGMVFVLLCLHAIGAHYTYSLVPWDDAVRSLSGASLNEALGVTRNHYDRVVHLAYGLLLVLPLREPAYAGSGATSCRSTWCCRPRRSTSSSNGRPRCCSEAGSAPPSSAPKGTNGTRTRTWPWPRSAR